MAVYFQPQKYNSIGPMDLVNTFLAMKQSNRQDAITEDALKTSAVQRSVIAEEPARVRAVTSNINANTMAIPSDIAYKNALTTGAEQGNIFNAYTFGDRVKRIGMENQILGDTVANSATQRKINEDPRWGAAISANIMTDMNRAQLDGLKKQNESMDFMKRWNDQKMKAEAEESNIRHLSLSAAYTGSSLEAIRTALINDPTNPELKASYDRALTANIGAGLGLMDKLGVSKDHSLAWADGQIKSSSINLQTGINRGTLVNWIGNWAEKGVVDPRSATEAFNYLTGFKGMQFVSPPDQSGSGYALAALMNNAPDEATREMIFKVGAAKVAGEPFTTADVSIPWGIDAKRVVPSSTVDPKTNSTTEDKVNKWGPRAKNSSALRITPSETKSINGVTYTKGADSLWYPQQ